MKPSNHYKSRNCNHSAILPHSVSNHQEFRAKISYSSHDFQNNRLAKISEAIEEKNLTECLECLEDVGIASELALFILAECQQGAAR